MTACLLIHILNNSFLFLVEEIYDILLYYFGTTLTIKMIAHLYSDLNMSSGTFLFTEIHNE